MVWVQVLKGKSERFVALRCVWLLGNGLCRSLGRGSWSSWRRECRRVGGCTCGACGLQAKPALDQQRGFARRFVMLRIIRLFNAFHNADKIDEIAATIMQQRIALTVAEAMEGVLGERDVELALVGALMNRARPDELIAFVYELLLHPVEFENLSHRHSFSDLLDVYPLGHKLFSFQAL